MHPSSHPFDLAWDVDYLKAHWQAVRRGLDETVAKLGDADLDFRPFPAAWTIRQLLLHIAQEETGERDYGIRQILSDFPSDFHPEDFPTVDSIQALLAAAHSPSMQLLDTLTSLELRKTITTPWGPSYSLLEMIGHLIEHEIHHRGELSLILGLLGREGLNA
jgi:uncharacterized damage-inducible protein DinB